MRRGSRGTLAAFLLTASLWVSLPAASQEGRTGISLAPVRVEFLATTPGPKAVTIFVKGATAGTVDIAMFDAVAGQDGRWQRVDYGSTPATLERFLEIKPSSFAYVPDGTEQRFTTTLAIDPSAAEDVRYGSLVASLTPGVEAAPGSSTVIAGVAIQVLTAQAAEAIPPADLRLSLDTLDVRARHAWTFLDRLLPDIPGVVGHGPAVMGASGRNTGEYVLDEVTVFEVRRVSPLVLLPFINEGEPRPILRVSMVPRYTLPGQSFTDETTTLIPLDGGGEVDALPFIGFVKVTARATGTLGGVEAQQGSRSRTVLVFPWSEGLFLLAAWSLTRGRRRRGHAETVGTGFLGRFRRQAERGVSGRFGGGLDDPEPPGPSADQLPLF